MNKVFKVVWSKVKNCYVVASELAKRRAKSPKSNVISKTIKAGMLAIILSFSLTMPLYAASYEAGGGSAVGYNSIAVGENAIANADHSIVIGVNAQSVQTENIAIGREAYVDGDNAVALGDVAKIYGDNSILVGSSGQTMNTFAYIKGDFNTAIGHNVTIEGLESSAFGNFSRVTADNSIAIGSHSVTNTSNVVSFGHTATDTNQLGNAYGSVLTRRLTNISNGVNDTDAVSLGQLKNEVRPADNGNYVNLNCKIS